MDCFPCKINFKITENPKLPYTIMALSEVQGNLNIYVNNELVFNEDYICLAEFASKLFKWLKNDLLDNIFIYDSMDYQDSPILRAEIIGEQVSLSSVWLTERASSPLLLNLIDFLNASKQFLIEFEKALPNIDLIYE